MAFRQIRFIIRFARLDPLIHLLNRMKPTLALLLLTLTTILARADETKTWPMPPMDYFLARIPAPPTAGDAMDQADLLYSQAIQAGATPEQIAHAQKMVAFSVFSFAEVLGPNFTAANDPQTAAFFKRVEATANGVKNPLKDHFARLRPVDAHKDTVKALVTYEAGYSYPSGHSTRSWLDALVLGELDPADRFAFIRLAGQVGFDRILGGMHYQTDVIASRALAELIFQSLQKDPDFQKEFEALRTAEWKSRPGK